jgi:hypothetical protein
MVWRPTWKLWRRDFWVKHRAPHEEDSIASLFIQKTRDITLSRTIRTPDPTSIEFQGLFHRILGDALKKQENVLMVVMDNLDRVPPEEALAVWSTMRTFFDTGTCAAVDWQSQFWVLVPFDPTALRRLWQRVDRGEIREQTDEDVPMKLGSSDANDLVRAFTDKTFQIQFRVSPPVLSDSKRFFYQQFKEAFPSPTHHSAAELYTVYRLFTLKCVPANRPVTPRDVKLFINKIGSFHRQWQDIVPLTMQALYLLYAGNIRDSVEALATKETKDFLGPDVQKLIGEVDWRTPLAALYFNVELDKAMQVLIRARVEEALRKGDVQGITQFQSCPGLGIVIVLVLEEDHSDWAEKEASCLAKAANVLEQAPLALEDDELDRAWEWICKGMSSVQGWSSLNKQEGQGIARALRHATQSSLPDVAQAMVKAISSDSALAEVKEGTPAPAVIDDWVAGSLPVVAALDELRQIDAKEQAVRVPGTPAVYLQVMTRLAGSKEAPKLTEYFNPSTDPSGIVNALSGLCKNGHFTQEHPRIIAQMMNVRKDWPWPQLVAAITHRLQAPAALPPHETEGCVRTLLVLKYEGRVAEADSALRNVSEQGHVLHHLHDAKASPDVSATCVFAVYTYVPDGNVANKPGHAAQSAEFYANFLQNPHADEARLDRFVDRVLELGQTEYTVATAKSAPNTANLATAVLTHIIDQHDAVKYIPAEFLVSEFGTIAPRLNDETLAKLVEKLISEGDLITQLASREFSPTLGKLYLLTYTTSTADERQTLVPFLLKGMGATTKKEWEPELQQEGSLLELLLLFVEDGLELGLQAGFQDALHEHSRKVLKGQTMPSRFVDRWEKTLSALKEHWRPIGRRNLWDELAAHRNTEVAGFVSVYGNVLLEAQFPTEKSDELVTHLFSDIIERSTVAELAWLSRMLQKKEVFQGAKSDTRKAFQDRVKSALTARPAEQLEPLLIEIARGVDLDPDEILETSEKEAEEKEETSDSAEPAEDTSQ